MTDGWPYTMCVCVCERVRGVGGGGGCKCVLLFHCYNGRWANRLDVNRTNMKMFSFQMVTLGTIAQMRPYMFKENWIWMRDVRNVNAWIFSFLGKERHRSGRRKYEITKLKITLLAMHWTKTYSVAQRLVVARYVQRPNAMYCYTECCMCFIQTILQDCIHLPYYGTYPVAFDMLVASTYTVISESSLTIAT